MLYSVSSSFLCCCYLFTNKCFSDGDEILINEQVGHMMRTKLTSCNEGGVHAGDGVLDSPFLIDD